MSEVTVKPLEWEHRPRTSDLYERWSSKTIIGEYRIVNVEVFNRFEWHLDGYGFAKAETSEDAMSAAQADYETRIMSALSTPLPVETTGWQPIETAPRDDTTVMLWNGHDMEMGWWYPYKEFPTSSEPLNKWVTGDAMPGSGYDCGMNVFHGATHWHPLPSRPAAPKGGE